MNKLIFLLLTTLLVANKGIAQVTPVPAEQCSTATIYKISDFEGFTNHPSEFSNPDGPTPLCPTGGVPHNLTWYAFKGLGQITEIEFDFSNCIVNGTGIQAGIVGGCDYKESIDCHPECNGPGKYAIRGFLEYDKVYYLFVDGCSGDLCDFTMHVKSTTAAIEVNPFRDVNNDCIFNNGESSLKYLTIVDEYKGVKTYHPYPKNKVIPIFDNEYGTHKFSVISKNSKDIPCSPIQLNIDANTLFQKLDLGIVLESDCPRMHIDISTNRLRFCSEMNYTINVRNEGFQPAADQQIVIELPDGFEFIDCSFPIESQIGQIITLKKHSYTLTETQLINLRIKTPCEQSKLGDTYCVTAKIVNIVPCGVNPNWNGAHISLRGSCDKNTNKVIFRVTNDGTADFGADYPYAIIEDDIMPLLKGQLKLPAGQYQDIELSATGKTYRIMMDQIKNHPIISKPTSFVEGCGQLPGGGHSQGYVMQFMEDEVDESLSTDCQILRGSYDPNEKLAYPEGYSDQKIIQNTDPLEYTLHFQNTGNGEAEDIVITDELHPYLDINTFEVIGASHPYNLEIKERQLRFTFKAIFLTWKADNEAASQGYISFRIKPIANLVNGTHIDNSAKIFFDSNPAITTDTVDRVIGKFSVKIIDVDKTNQINIYPNPAHNQINIDFEKENEIPAICKLTNLEGKLIFETDLTHLHNTMLLSKHLSQSGIYLLQIYTSSGQNYVTRLIYENVN